MKNFYFFIVTVGFFLTSCTSTKTIKFTQKPNEVQTTDVLSAFLSKSKNPKVVLRVKETSNNVTDKENNDYLYNAIENQLMASGFVVRDRQLFNQIIGNNENNLNYENLNKKSDTDLIIELTKLDRSVLYETNKYYDAKGNEKADQFNGPFKEYGATVEFKVVLIKNNQFADKTQIKVAVLTMTNWTSPPSGSNLSTYCIIAFHEHIGDIVRGILNSFAVIRPTWF